MSRNKTITLELAEFSQDLLDAIKWQQDLMHQIQFPSPRWREDPEGFFSDVLGVSPWDRQREILQACTRHDKIAVKSGRRVGKSVTISGLALWRWASFERGQALLTSATKDQLDRILWGEIAKMYHQAGVCVECRKKDPEYHAPCPHSAKLVGYMNRSSKGGLRSPDKAGLRTIFGKTAKTPAALAGFGSPDLITLIDEIEGLTPEVIEMLVGNLASGGVLAGFGNPLNPRGFFASCFKPESGWHQITISSRETPNYKSNSILIPGLATRKFVDGVVKEYGEKSPYVLSMIDGAFPDVDLSGAPVPVLKIKQANLANDTADDSGKLHIGLDVASYTPDGRNDATVFSLGRGKHHIALVDCAGYRDTEIVEKLFELVDEHRRHGELPHVNIDVGGIGYKIAEAVAHNPRARDVTITRVRSNERARREDKKLVYNLRDQMFNNLLQYLDAGGGLLASHELENQLPAHQWVIRHDGLATLNDKAKIRKACGRSPDHADAVMLMCLREPETTVVAVGRPSAPPARVTPNTYGGSSSRSRYDSQRRR